MSDTVRVFRIIVYEGSREWVEWQVENSVQGTKIIRSLRGHGKIHATTVAGFPEIIQGLPEISEFPQREED